MFFLSAAPQAACRSALWGGFAGHVLLPWALQGVEPRGELLELGSGSAAQSPQVHVTAPDLDPAMVRAAAARLARYRNAGAEQADVIRLPFADDSFDVVTCFLMLHHVGDWRRAIEQAYRVLRPGGTFVGYDVADGFLGRASHVTDH